MGKKIIIGLIGDSAVTVPDDNFFAEKGSNTNHGTQLREEVGNPLIHNELDTLISQKPNFVLIQFGHNDMLYYDTNTYSEKLKEYVERVTRSGSKAIVLSSVSRRNFDQNGNLLPES